MKILFVILMLLSLPVFAATVEGSCSVIKTGRAEQGPAHNVPFSVSAALNKFQNQTISEQDGFIYEVGLAFNDYASDKTKQFILFGLGIRRSGSVLPDGIVVSSDIYLWPPYSPTLLQTLTNMQVYNENTFTLVCKITKIAL